MQVKSGRAGTAFNKGVRGGSDASVGGAGVTLYVLRVGVLRGFTARFEDRIGPHPAANQESFKTA